MNLEQIDTSTTAGKAKVMQLAAEGRRVAYSNAGHNEWAVAFYPRWDWSTLDYAIICSITPQWQPIESVPKDGTAVLVMQNNWPGCKNGAAEECNGHNTYVAAWWADEREGAGSWICYMDAVRDPECPIQPTHWQPLPAPPEVP